MQAQVTGLDVDERVIHLDEGDPIDYDYCVVCLGSQTAFYGIDGLEEHALTLKSLGDAMTIHQQLSAAVSDATEDDPAQFVVGGAGLTGIQTAGEVAAYRDEHDAPVEIRLIEMEDEIFPGHDHEFQGAIRNKLDRKDIEISTGATVSEVDEAKIHFENDDPQQYDVFVWAGGVTGEDALADVDIDKDHNRAYSSSTFKTSDDRVLAIGDAALVSQDAEGGPLSEQDAWEAIVNPDTDDVPPPTAEAAMEEGEHVGKNVARMIDGGTPHPLVVHQQGNRRLRRGRGGGSRRHRRPAQHVQRAGCSHPQEDNLGAMDRRILLVVGGGESMDGHVNHDEPTVAVYFDIDGTLVERKRAEDEIVPTAEKFGIDLSDEQVETFDQFVQQYFRRNVEDGYREAVETFTEHLDVDIDIDAFTASLKMRKVENTCLVDGAKDVLDEFAERTRLGIITNGDGDIQRGKLSTHGIADYFDHVLISGERETMKPKDEMFAVAKREWEAEGYVYIADRLGDDIVPAKGNGFVTVWVSDESSPIPDLVVPTLGDCSVDDVLAVVYK